MFVFVTLSSASLVVGTAEVEYFEIRRGVNISHWLSQSGRRGEERRGWFTEKDVKLIASLGFDHIGLPVDEEQLWDGAGKKEAEAFELLYKAIGWANWDYKGGFGIVARDGSPDRVFIDVLLGR